jgi:hypothetical protein
VIVVAVRWYLRFNLSYRDVEELLVERGVAVDHVSIYRWVQRFVPLLSDAARFCRGPGDHRRTCLPSEPPPRTPEPGLDVPPSSRVAAAFTELAQMI